MRLNVILAVSFLIIGCTKPSEERISQKHDIADFGAPKPTLAPGETQDSNIERTVAELCEIKKYCKLTDGRLRDFIDACLKENLGCSNSSNCKAVRERLSQPSRYFDIYGNWILISNVDSKPQITSLGKDKASGGSGDDADIVRELKCN